jgi:hypothetical protein
MSVIEYAWVDPSTRQAAKTLSLSPSPLTLLGPYVVSFDSPGLTQGVKLGPPLPSGAVIYDVGIFTLSSWDGTTPTMDVGTFSGTTGLFFSLAGAAVEQGDALSGVGDNTPLQVNGDSKSWLAAAVASVAAAAGAPFNPPEIYASDVAQLLAVVSQDGTQGGTAAGSTTGTSNVYILAATPFTS